MSDIYDHGGEGDTPSFLYLISAHLGLNDPLQPTQGSWGSRFVPMGEEFPEGYYHTCGVDVNELMRWSEAAKNNFLNRLDYSLKDPQEVNHEPVAVINGDKSNEIIKIKAKAGQKLRLDASKSDDPDQDKLNWHWFQYQEADSYPDEIVLEYPNEAILNLIVPKNIGEKEIHLVLELQDKGTPSLTSYRRVIITAR